MPIKDTHEYKRILADALERGERTTKAIKCAKKVEQQLADERRQILESLWNILAKTRPGEWVEIVRLVHPDPHSDFILFFGEEPIQWATSPYSLAHKLCMVRVRSNGSGEILWHLPESVYRPKNRGK